MRAMLVACAVVLSACGVEGPAGPPGDSGATLASTYYCTYLGDVGPSEAAFQYMRYDFTDGSVMTSCSIADAEIENARDFVFSPSSKGAAEGACIMVRDVDNPSGGYWTFTHARNASNAFAVYKDPGGDYDSIQVVMSCRNE